MECRSRASVHVPVNPAALFLKTLTSHSLIKKNSEFSEQFCILGSDRAALVSQTVQMNAGLDVIRRHPGEDDIMDEMTVPTVMPRKLSHGTTDTTDDGSRVVGEKVLARGDWLELSQMTYIDPDGVTR